MLDKKISLGNIISLVVMLIGVVGAYYQLQIDIAKNKNYVSSLIAEERNELEKLRTEIAKQSGERERIRSMIAVQKQRVDDFERDLSRRLKGIEDKTNRIEMKIDRLIIGRRE